MTANAGLEPGRTVWVSLPPAFYDDHVSRGLPSGQEVARTSRRVTVALDAEIYRDLLSDAQFYIDMGVGEFGREFLGLIASARATVTALLRPVATQRLEEVGHECDHDRPEDQPHQNKEPVQQ